MQIISGIIFVGIPAILIVVGIIMDYKFKKEWGTYMWIPGTSIIMLILFSLIMSNIIIYSDVVKYRIEKDERTYVTIQYEKEWNKTLLSIFIPDDVDGIE